MKNQSITAIFEKLADLMEIKDVDPFRVRAYRKAAAEIDGLTENLTEIAKRDMLEDIPGIGKAISQKIKDILETGTTPMHEELKAELPETLIDILAIPGIGPKTVKQLYYTLGISSIDELEEAARNQQLRKNIRLGAKAEAGIIRSIENMRVREERISLGNILSVAEDIVERLERSHGIAKAVAAGSIRRRRDTVGDIDIVAEVYDINAAIDAFTHLPYVDEIIEIGETKCAVRLRSGMRMDLRLTDKSCFGSMLHHFTGSQQHNIRMRGMAKDKGLSISEYGVFNSDTGEKAVDGYTEEDIFAVNGLPWIPPELREDRGEIEAGLANALPKLIEVSDIKCDLHVHSTASDGGNTISEIAEAAKSAGYTHVSICDHSKSLAIAHGLTEDRLMAQMNEIKQINASVSGIKILSGIEADIRADGTLDADPDLLNQLDLVVGSIHQRYKNTAEEMTARIIKAFETGMIDIFGHPTGRIINSRDPYEFDIEKVFDAAKANSVAMEINASPDRLDLNDVHIRMASKRGLKFAINTDAHNTSEFASVRFGVYTARRGWLEASDVLNAMTIDELYRWLNTRRPRKSFSY